VKDVQIVIPSHLRAGSVTTIPSTLDPDMAVVCVPEAQADEYAEKHPEFEIVAHPDDGVGITMKRQWSFDLYGDAFMLDDDVLRMRHFEHKKLACHPTPAMVYDLIQRLAYQARDLGIYLFAFSPYGDIRTFNPLRPMKVTGMAIGGSFGMLAGSKLWYNASVVTCDDYWISALNAHYHRMCLVDLRYDFDTGNTFTKAGGCSSIRTLDTERRDNEILRESFGKEVFPKKARTPFSKGLTGHEEQRTLNLPL